MSAGHLDDRRRADGLARRQLRLTLAAGLLAVAGVAVFGVAFSRDWSHGSLAVVSAVALVPATALLLVSLRHIARVAAFAFRKEVH